MVFVDELQRWPTKIPCFRAGSCHLMADTPDELHVFAAKLGLRRSWFQEQSTPHYDLTPSKRELALKLGAVFIPAREQAKKRNALRQQKIREQAEMALRQQKASE